MNSGSPTQTTTTARHGQGTGTGPVSVPARRARRTVTAPQRRAAVPGMTPVSPGTSPLERTAWPVGQVGLVGRDGQRGVLYTCDPEHHCIHVTDHAGHPLFTFGSQGSGPGQFKQPSDVALVPVGGVEDVRGHAPLALVVADRDNHRLQLFELDGALMGTIDPWQGRGRHIEWVARAGWPFFRLNPVPQLVLPSRLSWRHPYLDVLSADGQIVEIDLPLALLPDFETWLAQASRTEAKRALDHFRQRPAGVGLPEAYLRAITAKVRSGLTLITGDPARRPCSWL